MNKKVILLLLAVLAIWGTIGYRIYVGLTTEESSKTIAVQQRPIDTTRIVEEPLLLNYRDPFDPVDRRTDAADIKIGIPLRRTSVNNRPVISEVPAETIDWKTLQYIGTVGNKSNGRLVALVLVRGEERYLKINESVEGFLLAEITPDSIRVLKGKQYYYLKKKL